MSPKNVVNKILNLEKKYNLFKIEIDNIFFYQLIRMNLYYYIVGKKKIYNPQKSFSYRNFLKILFYILKDILYFKKRKKLFKNDVCIIQHPRRIDNKDIYTYYIKKIFKNFTVLHQSAGNNFSFDKNSINYDYYLIKKKIFSLVGISNCKKNHNLKKIILIFKKTFQLDNDFDSFFYSSVQDQLNSYKIASKFLKNTKFKKIIVVNSYANKGLIYAANILNIKTVELQHGIINKNHLGYHFPKIKKNKLESFPNELILYGNFWKDKANFPIERKKIFSLGSPYFEENYIKFKKIKKKNGRILILSQQTTQKYLLKFIGEIIKNNKNIKFTYKAHPKEDITVSTNYFKKYNLINNVDIVKGNKNVYSLFKNHETQIGVFSTALFEGYACKLKTGILKAPGWENIKFLKNYNNVHMLKNFTDFYKMINLKNKKFSENFYKRNSKKNLNKFLSLI